MVLVIALGVILGLIVFAVIPFIFPLLVTLGLFILLMIGVGITWLKKLTDYVFSSETKTLGGVTPEDRTLDGLIDKREKELEEYEAENLKDLKMREEIVRERLRKRKESRYKEHSQVPTVGVGMIVLKFIGTYYVL